VSNNNPETEAQANSGLLLAALRSAVLRCKLDENELITIGTALKAGLITDDCAIAWLADIGLVDQVIADEAGR
jgi:hypothetical protein